MLGPERERYNLWEWNTYGNGDRGLLNQSLELAFGTFARITFGMGMSIPSCNLEVRSLLGFGIAPTRLAFNLLPPPAATST